MPDLGSLRTKTPRWWMAAAALLAILVVSACYVGRRVRNTNRRARALMEMSGILKAIAMDRMCWSHLPESLDDFRRGRPGNDGDPMIEPADDPWGHPYVLLREGTGPWSVTCMGADGKPGGEGDDADFGPTFEARTDSGTPGSPPK